jgi:4-hydroxy-tetrahydrodipicolinate reductase
VTIKTKTRIGLVGAFGRMGQRVVRLLEGHPTLELGVILSRTLREAPAPVVLSAAEAVVRCDVILDFAAPPACRMLGPACAERGVPYVLASTGLAPEDEAAVAATAERVAVLQAANLSVGVNVMLELVALAARQLTGFDIEISEVHHRHKRDAPSGTALALGAAARASRPDLEDVVGRRGVGHPRHDKELGYAALRGGDVAGEHTVYFFGGQERLEITHRSNSGDIFASGALTACAWLTGRAPGRYTMQDVFREKP